MKTQTQTTLEEQYPELIYKHLFYNLDNSQLIDDIVIMEHFLSFAAKDELIKLYSEAVRLVKISLNEYSANIGWYGVVRTFKSGRVSCHINYLLDDRFAREFKVVNPDLDADVIIGETKIFTLIDRI